ncbi:MAG: M20/M25/M40 family metallo-hydrolase [Candidatus Kerfeldbacteria bacterium]|nr:M20/M25/M40 family metallo-hydrolase [Candidatus Kerfeldbacteria bacterium]
MQRLLKNFLRLVKISSPSGSEAVIRKVMITQLRQLGVKITVDHAGNVIGRLAGYGQLKSAPPYLLSAHLDTVQPCSKVKPVVRGSVIMSDGSTILGADDKAGLSIIIEVLQQLHDQPVAHLPLEIVLTVGEETYTAGARQLDISKLHSATGVTVDGTTINCLNNASPGIALIDVTVQGKAAHSGMEPEQGISAIHIAAAGIARMKLGRISSSTTANIGFISGGSNRNSIPDRVTIQGEVRSHSPVQLEQQLERMHKALEDAAEQYGGTLHINSQFVVPSYSLKPINPALRKVRTVLERQLGQAVDLIQSCGVSDANIFNHKGITVVDVGTGVQRPHTVAEQIDLRDMEMITRVVFDLIDTSNVF